MNNDGYENLSEVVTIYGRYEHTIWRNELDGFTFFSLKVNESVAERNRRGEIVCAGRIQNYDKGIPLRCEGTFVEEERGLKLEIIKIREAAIDEITAIEYLSSGICPGFGHANATKLVNHIGKDIFGVLIGIDAIQKIQEALPNYTEASCKKLIETVTKTTRQRVLFEYLGRYGGTWNSALRIFKHYGLTAINDLRKNPYEAMRFGMKFEQCDKMALDFGFHAANPKRLKAAVMCCMERNGNSGSTYAYLETITENCVKLLAKSAFKNGKVPISDIGHEIEACEALNVEKNLYNKVWDKRLKQAEDNIALQIKRLMRTALPQQFDPDLVDYAENLCGIKYADKQREAFELLRQSGVAVITGGPGTGKTTTVNGIINAYEQMYPDNQISLCAPTGRAAQRMSESTGRDAVTLHRLIDYRPYGDSITCKSAEDPLCADLIVVDETSMLDTEIASLFFSAVKDGTMVLLIGDVDQLPSVGAGNVLHDIIWSEKIPVVKLSAVYRQSGQSPIVANANAINIGDTDLESTDDFKIIYCKNDEAIMPEVIEAVQRTYDPDHPFDTQVLVPTHKGGAGAIKINRTLQELLNPKSEHKKELKFGQKVYREGDKIIMLSNNYEKGYCNGDLGIISCVKSHSFVVDIMGNEIEITGELLNDVNLAYAMTIHKSQGSEFKNVVISLPCQPMSMLKRNLIYTAVTRAKKTVTIVSEFGALKKSIESCDTGKRLTELRQKLQKYLTKGDTTCLQQAS